MKNQQKDKPILIYGAHLYAAKLYESLCRSRQSGCVCGFAVTNMASNPSDVHGVAVKSIEEYMPMARFATVKIAMPDKFHAQVDALLESYGVKDIQHYGIEEITKLVGQEMQDDFEATQSYALLWDNIDFTWLSLFRREDVGASRQVEESMRRHPHIRHQILTRADKFNVTETVNGRDWLQEAKLWTGNATYAYELETSKRSKLLDTVRVYVVTSMGNNAVITSNYCIRKWEFPIQAGSALTDRIISEIRDDVDNNISSRNKMYCELTAAYWIWKNVHDCEYNGLCHYRRHFHLDDEQLSTVLMHGFDCILPIVRFVPCGVGKMFMTDTPVKSQYMESLQKAMNSIYPRDKDILEEVLNGNFYYPNNMVIAKKSIYDDYCAYIYPVLFEMESDERNKGIYEENNRNIAFAGELLTTLYFFKHRNDYKICLSDINFIYHEKKV